jgi:hypothetical protein
MIVACTAILFALAMRLFGFVEVERRDSGAMHRAALQTARWYDVIAGEKEKR